MAHPRKSLPAKARAPARAAPARAPPRPAHNPSPSLRLGKHRKLKNTPHPHLRPLKGAPELPRV